MMGAMFGDDGPVNPLEGGTLYWARADGDALYVYSLAIDDHGAFALDRYACHPAAGDALGGHAAPDGGRQRSAAGAEAGEGRPMRRIASGSAALCLSLLPIAASHAEAPGDPSSSSAPLSGSPRTIRTSGK